MFERYLRPLSLLVVAVLVAAVFAIQGCSKNPNVTAEPSESEQTTESTESSALPGEEPMHTSNVQVKGDEVAVIKTSKGVIKFEFYPEDAPNTVASFIELAQSQFYDGTKFHRVEKQPQPFVVQGGDPLTKDPNANPGLYGTGGPGYRLKAEFNSRKHVRGTVAMARSQDPDSAGSQFYICLADAPFLDGQYTVFGQVIEGMDVVDKIEVGDVMESVEIVSGE